MIHTILAIDIATWQLMRILEVFMWHCSFCCSLLSLSFVPPLGVSTQLASMDEFGRMSLASLSLLFLSVGIVVDIIAIIQFLIRRLLLRRLLLFWRHLYKPMTNSINEERCCTMTTFVIVPCSLRRWSNDRRSSRTSHNSISPLFWILSLSMPVRSAARDSTQWSFHPAPRHSGMSSNRQVQIQLQVLAY